MIRILMVAGVEKCLQQLTVSSAIILVFYLGIDNQRNKGIKK